MEKVNKLLNNSLLGLCMALLTNCGGSGFSGSPVSDPVVSEDNTSMSADGAGVKLGHGTELSTSFSGLSIENVYVIDGNDKKISSSKVALNTKFSVVYEGVKNYVLKDGKAFPVLSIQVMDNDQQTIINEADLLGSRDGLSEKDASILRATITVGDPIKPGKYICSIQVMDKNNINAAIVSTWDFEVE